MNKSLIAAIIGIILLLSLPAGIAASTPAKGASFSAAIPESIFTLNFDKSPADNLQFKYDETKNQWLVSATCTLKKGITVSPEETSDFIDVLTFLGNCEDNNLNVIITDSIFSGTETFEEGKEALCSYYAEDSIKKNLGASLWIAEKKILPLTGIGGTDEELRGEIKESCLDQIYMATEGSITAETEIEEHEDLSEIGEGTQEVEGTAQAPNSQLCEIDSVWITAGTSLNIEKAVKTLIFTLTGWQPFDEVCKPKAPATGSTTPSGKKYSWSSQYDPIINQKLTIDMEKNGFDLNLIKALISHESAFQPQAISTAGCIGLMQICYTSVPSATPLYKKTTCCEAGEDSPKQTCTSEVKQTKHLWQEGVFNCNPTNDDRFDPKKNIAMGLELLSKKYAQCNTVDGALSAYASGSCNKRLDYAETIQGIKNSHKNE